MDPIPLARTEKGTLTFSHFDPFFQIGKNQNTVKLTIPQCMNVQQIRVPWAWIHFMDFTLTVSR
jgi:hypothetical protein